MTNACRDLAPVSPRWSIVPWAMVILLVATGPVRGTPACVGDCDGDGRVTVDEIVLGVNLALGAAAVETCTAFDTNGDVAVSVDEILLAVNNALSACGSVQPTPDPTPTATATTPGSSTVRLTSEQTLRIEFTTHPPFVEQNPNTLYALVGNVDRIEPYGLMSGALYDGETLLGLSSSTTGGCGVGAYSLHPAPTTWKSATSPWNHPAGDPATVDFTALLDGTIQGRIDIEIDAGSFDLSLSEVSLQFIHATFANGGSSIPPAPRVSSVSIVPRAVPPGTQRPCPTTPATATRTPTPTGGQRTATPTHTGTPTTTLSTATPQPTQDDDD